MPSIEWNKSTWDSQYNWDLKGEEWSKSWGSSEAQWYSSLYPRIHRFIGCENILEIASGYGRWTKFLSGYAIEKYKGIDLSQECIDYCNEHFKSPDVQFIKNDGVSLKDVSDLKYDFVFSFDSLVHVSIDVLQKYISQIIDILVEDGVCFLHHSNFGALIESGVVKEGHKGYKHNRDQSSSATKVREIVMSSGGKILCQEVLDWGGADAIDCFTTFCKTEAFPDSVEKQFTNNQFMEEAGIIKKVHHQYCGF